MTEYYWDWYWTDDARQIELRITSDHPDHPIIARWTRKPGNNQDELRSKAQKLIRDLREGRTTLAEVCAQSSTKPPEATC
jgi:hypothetical protein